MNLHKLLIASLIFFVASCTTVHVGDKYGYRASYTSYNPFQNKSNHYRIFATVLDIRQGWVKYQENIFIEPIDGRNPMDTFYMPESYFLYAYKKLK